MTANEVLSRVLGEINGEWSRPTSHNLDLRKSLVDPPRQIEYSFLSDDIQAPLWLVIEASPDTHDGYEVVYDDARDQFGLGMLDENDRHVFLGNYGTLWEALEGM